MKRIVGFVAVLTVVFVLIASPGYAIAGVTGTATTDNTILGVRVGNTVVKVGTDLAQSLNTSTLRATGKFVTATIGPATLDGGAQRTATSSSNSGKESIGTGTFSLSNLASLTVTDGLIETLVANDRVSSAVDFVVGNVNALAGFTTLGTTTSSTDSAVGVNSSNVLRNVQLGSLDVLDLGTLLSQLGINPLALACSAVEDAGAALGLAGQIATACDTLGSVLDPVAGTGEIPDVMSAIGDTSGILGTLEGLLASPCGLLPAGTCTPVLEAIAALTDEIDAINLDAPDTCATVLAALDDVTGQLQGIEDTLLGIDVLGIVDLDAIIAAVTSQLGALDAAGVDLTTICNTLAGIVDGLLDTSLLNIDVANVAMNLVAKESPSASATGSIGAVRVGNITVADGAELQSIAETLQGAIGDVTDALGGVLNSLGLSLPTPELSLLTSDTDKGKRSDGMFFANGSFSVAHVGLDSVTVPIPANLPLDVLTGFAGFAPAAVSVAAVTTPAVSVDAGVFSGEATFKAGAALPVTGVGSAGLAISGLLSLAGAGVIRRIVRAF